MARHVRLSLWGRLVRGLRRLIVLAAVLFGIYVGFIAAQIYRETKILLERPAVRIFSAPLHVAVGDTLSKSRTRESLQLQGYKEKDRVVRAGEFNLHRDFWAIYTQPQHGAAGERPGTLIEMTLEADRVTGLVAGGKPRSEIDLEPQLLAAYSHDDRSFRIPLKSEEIPDAVVKAFVAAEDRNFFEHHGISITGILRALWVNLQEGEYRQGGSTITQQLAKNIFLSREKTLGRKVKEVLIALYLDARLTKEEILTLYLNEVYLGQAGGRSVMGIGAASRHYFGLDVSNLSVSEAALLAGITPGPSNFNPFRHPDKAIRKRNVVLDRMVESGFLKEEAARALKSAPIGVLAEGEGLSMGGYFLDYLLASESVGKEARRVMDDNGDVFTTLDPALQKAAESAVRRGLERLRGGRKPAKNPGDIQAALVALDPRTGAIRAMVGGDDYRRSPFNRATEARRQVGSTFKPFVYAAAFEYLPGFNDRTPLLDEPVSFPDGRGGHWSPKNEPEGNRGEVTAREALAQSINVAAVRLADRVGFDRVANLAEKTGVRPSIAPLPSMALGAVEASPLDLARAFTVFPGAGLAVNEWPVTDLISDHGKRFAVPPQKPRRVLEDSTAYQVTSMMQEVVTTGTGARAREYPIAGEVAGKTGTTNDLKDAWFAGFSPALVAVVWVGRDSGQPLGLSGASAALPVWGDFMAKATQGMAGGLFQVPESVGFESVCLMTGLKAATWCPRASVAVRKDEYAVMDICPRHDSPIDTIRRWWQTGRSKTAGE